MLVSPDTASVNEWLNDLSLTQDSRYNRRYVVRLFEEANHASIAQILAELKADRTTPYAVSKRFMDHIRKGRAPYTCYVYRSMLFGLLVATLGEENCRKSVFHRLVTYEPPYVVRTKRSPNPENLRAMLLMATPLYRALIGLLACTGTRIGEALTRKMSDLEIRPDGHARITLRASETKARNLRYVFATKEVMDWVDVYRKSTGTKSEYVFPGDRTGHLRYGGVQEGIKNLFRKVGLQDSPDKSFIYSAHSLRTFADTQMGRAGLDRKWIELIIGHKNSLAASGSYKDWDAIEEEWVKTCADKMQFLTHTDPQIAEVKGENADLKALLAAVLKRLS
jgi:integrase